MGARSGLSSADSGLQLRAGKVTMRLREAVSAARWEWPLLGSIATTALFLVYGQSGSVNSSGDRP